MKKNIPIELRYTKSHEWSHHENGVVAVGITDYAQELLGDVVFLELPEIETFVSAGDEVGVIESVKAATDLCAPINGTVVAVNYALIENPNLINQDPYATGWIFKIQPDDDAELNELLDAEEYQELIESLKE